MSKASSEKIVKNKIRIGVINALLDELKKLNPKTVKEEELRIFFNLTKDAENESYRKFLVAWGLPFDLATPRWCGGENNSTMEPASRQTAIYLNSISRIFKTKISSLKKELKTLET